MNYLVLLFLIFLIPLSISLIRNILEDTYTWQIKEYRFDRIWAYLKYDNSKKFRGIYYNLPRILLLIGSMLFFLLPLNYFLIVPVLVLVLNLFYSIDSIKTFISGKFIRPKIKSVRNILILGISFVINLLLVWSMIFSVIHIANELDPQYTANLYPTIEDFSVREESVPFAYYDGSTFIIPFALIVLFIWVGDILFLDLIQSLIVTFGVFVTWPMSWFKRRRIIKKAKQKLTKFPELKIIGITGSFGKTSTKEILSDILIHKYKTLITPGNFNTAVGIAQTILNDLNSEHEVFIAEMGAYTTGEVKDSALLATPNISIITNIGKSHLDIFGSVENILRAKSEIYTNLKRRGIAIVNADNPKLYNYSKSLTKPKIFFGESDIEEKNYLKMSNVDWQEDNRVNFELTWNDETVTINTTIIGRHQIYNLLGAIAIALQLKFKLVEIKEILKDKEFKSSHFSTFQREDGTVIIDDAYNSNPDGFYSALEYLSLYNKKRIIFTRGLQEVGSEIRSIYNTIAEKIVDNADVLITTDKLLYKHVRDYHEDFHAFFFETEDSVQPFLQDYFGNKSVILVEGRVGPDIMDFLKSK